LPYSIRTQVARGRREEAVGNRALDRPSPSKVLSLSITCDPAVHVQRSALDCILLIHPRPDPCSVKCPQHLFRTIFALSTWCPKHLDPRVHPLHSCHTQEENHIVLQCVQEELNRATEALISSVHSRWQLVKQTLQE